MSLRVAIDIDGVVSDQLGKMREIAERNGIKDHSWMNFYDGIWKTYTEDDRQLAKIIFEDNLEEFILDQKPHEGALKTWKKLLANKKIIPYLVTSRKEENKDLTFKWLSDHGFEDTEVFFLKDKTEAPCSVLIDDHIKHVNSYIDKARMGVLMRRPYNKDEQVLKSVDNLDEFYQMLLPYV